MDKFIYLNNINYCDQKFLRIVPLAKFLPFQELYTIIAIKFWWAWNGHDRHEMTKYGTSYNHLILIQCHIKWFSISVEALPNCRVTEFRFSKSPLHIWIKFLSKDTYHLLDKAPLHLFKVKFFLCSAYLRAALIHNQKNSGK